MDGPSLKRAGALLFIGVVEFAFGFILSEIYYPGYSVSSNYISDLGATCGAAPSSCNFVQPSSTIFNSSIALLGVILLLTSYSLWRGFGSKAITVFVVLSAVGCLGVGTFNESYGIVHALFSALTFVSIGILAIITTRVVRGPMVHFSRISGLATLLATSFFLGGTYFGLGAGGMERMIVYPVLFWSFAFAGYLLGSSSRELF